MENFSPVNDEVLGKAKKLLVNLSSGWITGVTKGTCLNLDGKEFVDPHTHCHSWVGTAFYKIGAYNYEPKYSKGAKPFLTLSCHSRKRMEDICSKEASDALILWLARESPFAEHVLNRDDEENLLEGGVVLLSGPGGLTPAQTLWVCKVLRYGVEGSNALDVWYSLVQGGVNPLVALLSCTYIRSVKGATFGFTGAHGHSTVFRDSADVGSLLNGTPSKSANKTADVFWSDKTGKKVDRLAKLFQSFCTTFERSDGWGGSVTSEGADRDDLVQKVLAWQKTFEDQKEEEVVDYSPSSSTVYLDLDL